MNPDEILRDLEDQNTGNIARSFSTARARRMADRIPRRQAPTLDELVGQPNQRPWRRNTGQPSRITRTSTLQTETTPVPVTQRSPSVVPTEVPDSPRTPLPATGALQPENNTPRQMGSPSPFHQMLRHQLENPGSDVQSNPRTEPVLPNELVRSSSDPSIKTPRAFLNNRVFDMERKLSIFIDNFNKKIADLDDAVHTLVDATTRDMSERILDLERSKLHTHLKLENISSELEELKGGVQAAVATATDRHASTAQRLDKIHIAIKESLKYTDNQLDDMVEAIQSGRLTNLGANSADAQQNVTPAPAVENNVAQPEQGALHTATSLAQEPAPVRRIVDGAGPSIGENQLKSILTDFKNEIKSEINNSVKNKTKNKNKKSKGKSSRDNSDRSATTSESSDTQSSDSDEDKPLAEWSHGNKSSELGPKYKKLKVIVPNDNRFADVVNYRRYRLVNQDQSQGRRVTNKSASRFRKIQASLPCEKFTGSPPLNIINYLGELKDKFDRSKISEGAAFLILKDLLDGECRTEYVQHVQMGQSKLESVSSWPEAVNYLLSRYCKNIFLHNAIIAWDSLSQSPTESVEDFYRNLRKVATSCGNIFDTTTFITRFIKGLLPAVRPAVMSTHEKTPFTSLGDAISAAMHAENTYRETSKKLNPSNSSSNTERTRPMYTRARARNNPSAVTVLKPDRVTFADEHQHSITDSEIAEEDAQTGTSTRLAYEVPDSIPSSPQLSTQQTQVYETHVPNPAQYRGTSLSRPPRSQQPGWNNKTTRPPPRNTIVCHTCFAKNHISPDCDLYKNLDKYSEHEYNKIVMTNYYNLMPETKKLLADKYIGPVPKSELMGDRYPQAVVEEQTDASPPPKPDSVSALGDFQ